MSLKLKIVAGGMGLIGIAYAVDQANLATNYKVTDARLVSVKVECYVQAGRSKVVDKNTNSVAYMDCGMAPTAAQHFGYSKSDIKRRATLKYEYRSPVDGTRQMGSYVQSNAPKYSVGQHVKVYAHTSEPQKSRFN